MEYLLILGSPAWFLLAWRNRNIYRKVKHTGQIHRITSAKNKMTLFLNLGLFSIFLFILFLLTS